MQLGGPSSFFFGGDKEKDIFPFACTSNFALPRKKRMSDRRLMPIANPNSVQYRISLQGTKEMFVFSLRRGISDFGLTQGINRAREDEFVILAWE